MIEDDIRKFLPQYLSVDSTNVLMDELKRFPDNLYKKFYTKKLESKPVIFQGDGIGDLAHVDILSMKSKQTFCFVLSNTCDIDLNNKRIYDSNVLYAPIIEIDKYKKMLLNNNISESRVENHITTIKSQRLTPFFYLPAYEHREEAFIRFDMVTAYPNSEDFKTHLIQNRTFSLSDFGAYLLLFKLSVHFSRIQENQDRGYIC